MLVCTYLYFRYTNTYCSIAALHISNKRTNNLEIRVDEDFSLHSFFGLHLFMLHGVSKIPFWICCCKHVKCNLAEKCKTCDNKWNFKKSIYSDMQRMCMCVCVCVFISMSEMGIEFAFFNKIENNHFVYVKSNDSKNIALFYLCAILFLHFAWRLVHSFLFHIPTSFNSNGIHIERKKGKSKWISFRFYTNSNDLQFH